jgi:hypothetical protein
MSLSFESPAAEPEAGGAAGYPQKHQGSGDGNEAPSMKRVVEGEFELPIPAAEAINLFTPEGERAWAPGWTPVYPAGEASESTGTVFTTAADGVETIWVVQKINRRNYSATYSRVTPGRHAGTVNVQCADVSDDECTVKVTYDLTLLPGADAAALDGYSDPSFGEMMNEWASRIRSLSI